MHERGPHGMQLHTAGGDIFCYLQHTLIGELGLVGEGGRDQKGEQDRRPPRRGAQGDMARERERAEEEEEEEDEEEEVVEEDDDEEEEEEQYLLPV